MQRSGSADQTKLRAALAGAEPSFVRWTPERAAESPELVEAVEEFDAGELPAAVAATRWLRELALREPLQSATQLCVGGGHVLGYHALANGDVVLRTKQRKQMGVYYPSQPAVIVTWMAKSAVHPLDGSLLLLHAIGVAQRLAADSMATVLGLDPFDAETAEMWRSRYHFRNSAEKGPGRDLPRMFLPLQTA